MAFEIEGIDKENFTYLNDFFDNGKTGGSELIENPQKLYLPDVEVTTNEWYLDGLRIGYSEWKFQEPKDLEWSYKINSDIVTLQANICGSMFLGSPSSSHEIFNTRHHNLFYAAGSDANSGFMRGDKLHAAIFFIQFRKEAFLKLTQNANESLDRFAERILSDKTSALSQINLILNSEMLDIISSIVSCPYEAGLKKMYLLSKSIEFLVLQAEACNSVSNLSSGNKYIKKGYDIDCLLYARTYVKEHLHDPPSLPQLSKQIGLNEYKLKRGFKELFGTTVFGFVAEERLKIAEIEIKSGNKSMSTIATELGFSSPQHFSYAFKKRFGYSPNSLKR